MLSEILITPALFVGKEEIKAKRFILRDFNGQDDVIDAIAASLKAGGVEYKIQDVCDTVYSVMNSPEMKASRRMRTLTLTRNKITKSNPHVGSFIIQGQLIKSGRLSARHIYPNIDREVIAEHFISRQLFIPHPEREKVVLRLALADVLTDVHHIKALEFTGIRDRRYIVSFMPLDLEISQ